MEDYDIPFDGMSREEFMYRAMNPEDPMYMGPEEDMTFDGYDEADMGLSDDMD